MRLPLEGVRIADLTAVWAGPYGTKLLADMGAEIIKVESPEHYDVIRSLHGLTGDVERVYNKSAYFNEYNRNKRSLALDLSNDKGREAFTRLVRISDVVMENFRADVMDTLGLTYEYFRSVKPDIIMVSMPAYGKTGPERDHVGYGPNIEQTAGLVALSGYLDGPPQKSGISYGDPMSGALVSGIVAMALLYLRRTGKGQYIDISQRENLTGVLGEAVLDWSMNQRIWSRRGNRHPSMAPHGCYRCAGDDEWVTVAIATDDEWANLCRAMGKPELADDPRFATILARYAHQDEADDLIQAWTERQDSAEVMALLQKAGVAAGRVNKPIALLSDPHLAARGFFQAVPHPDAGTYPITSPVWQLADGPVPIRRHAPCFGEHNDEVLSELLGYAPGEIEELYKCGATAREPIM